jgi:hypothetical protein
VVEKLSPISILVITTTDMSLEKLVVIVESVVDMRGSSHGKCFIINMAMAIYPVCRFQLFAETFISITP